MSSKYTSKGGVLKLSITAVFTAIAATDSIDGPDPDVEVVDTTTLDGAVGKTKGVTGYTDSGTAGGSCFFDPADTTHKAITAFLSAPASSSWELIFPDVAPTTWSWSAYVTKFKPTLKVGEFLKADFSMAITGLVTGW